MVVRVELNLKPFELFRRRVSVEGGAQGYSSHFTTACPNLAPTSFQTCFKLTENIIRNEQTHGGTVQGLILRVAWISSPCAGLSLQTLNGKSLRRVEREYLMVAFNIQRGVVQLVISTLGYLPSLDDEMLSVLVFKPRCQS
jgi:hypothetical protein